MHSYLLSVSTAFLMGLLGGVHCVGMCGGLVCAINHSATRTNAQDASVFSYQLSYNLGRIFTYMILGALTGIFGLIVSYKIDNGGGYFLRYFSSAFVILVGFYIADWWKIISKLELIGQLAWRYLSKLTRYVLPVQTVRQAFFLGGLWGLLPCGLVYSALFYSLSAGSWLAGASLMFFFGIGTLPALLLVGTTVQRYQNFLQQNGIRQAFGGILIILGGASLFLLFKHHGLQLDCVSPH